MRSPHLLAPSQERASRYFDHVPRLIEFSYGELMREIKVRRLQFQSPLVHHILQEKFGLDTKWPNGAHERHVLIGRCNWACTSREGKQDALLISGGNHL